VACQRWNADVCGCIGRTLAAQCAQTRGRCRARAVSVRDYSVTPSTPLSQNMYPWDTPGTCATVHLAASGPVPKSTSIHVTCPTLDPSIAMFGFASIATWPLTMLQLVNACTAGPNISAIIFECRWRPSALRGSTGGRPRPFVPAIGDTARLGCARTPRALNVER
jgi:hypothetical protein